MRGLGRLTALLAAMAMLLAPAGAAAQPAAAAAMAVQTTAQAAPPAELYGARIDGKTFVERAIGKCVGAGILAALVGTAIGAAAGDAGKGAVIGVGVGAVVCVLLLRAANKKDKARIRDLQLAAFNRGAAQEDSWTTAQGGEAAFIAAPAGQGSVLLTKAGSLKCRKDDQCMVGDSWYPREQILAGEIDANAPKLVRASFEDAQQLVCRRARVSLTVDGQAASGGTDTACLVGDTWVTTDKFKKHKIRESDVLI